MSARGLVIAEGLEGAAGSRSRRLVGGFGGVVAHLAKIVEARGVRLLRETIARRVAWQRHRVTVEVSRGGPLEADAVVIAVPLGVLAAGALEIDPLPEECAEAIGRLAFGSAVRLTFLFDSPFWEEKDEELAFLRLPEGFPFNVAWTQRPVRAPLLTVWAGGPSADEVRSRSAAALFDAALEAIGAALDRSVGSLRRALVRTFHHDWTADPFTRGAYTWTPVGAIHCARVLSRTFEGTLAFAGEHTHEDELGTVQGAIESGERAALALLAGS